MELIDLYGQLSRVDERTQIIQDEMRIGFTRMEESLRTHVAEDVVAHKRITVLESAAAKYWAALRAGSILLGVLSTVAGIAYYVVGVIHIS